MRVKIQSIFREVDPYRVAMDLKIPITESDHRYFIPHPSFPGRTLELHNREFVSMDPKCEFVAGDIFDYLALYFSGSYSKAVRHVITHYVNLANNPASVSLISMLEYFTQDLTSTRNRFLSVYNLHKNWDSGVDNGKVKVWLSGQGIDYRQVSKIIYMARGADLRKLVGFELGDLNEKDFFVVYPYYSDYHTVAAIQIQAAKPFSVATPFVLNESRHSFLGLHSYTSRRDHAKLFLSNHEMLKYASSAHRLGNLNHGVIHTFFNPDGIEEGITLKKVVAMESGNSQFGALVKHRLLAEEFFVADKNQDLMGIGGRFLAWREYVIRAFQALAVQDQRYSLRIADFVQHLKSDLECCAVLMQWLSKHKATAEFVSAIRKQLDRRESYVSGNMEILTTSNGYKARKVNTSLELLFTNFLLQVDNMVWFEDVEEMFYAGRVLISGGEYPILFPKRIASKPLELENVMIAAVRRLSKGNNPPLPLITDTTYQKYLNVVVSQQAIHRPQLTGVRKLGWNENRTAFITPTWQARTMGVAPTSRQGYPGITAFESSYTFMEFNYQSHGTVSPHFCSFIALLVALLGKAYRGEFLEPIKFRDTPVTRRLLYALFCPLGQKSILELNQNRRGPNLAPVDPDFFCRYPVYGVCQNEAILEEVSYPIFLLSTSGISVDENLEKPQYPAMVALSYQIITEVVLGLIRNQGEGYVLSTMAKPNVHELILEGKRMIEAYTKVSSFVIFESDLPLMKSALSRIAFDDVGKYFKFHLETQKVSLNLRYLVSSRPHSIYQELHKKNEEVTRVGRHHLELPNAWACEMLSEFYGRPVVLYNSSQPIEELDSAQEENEPQLVTL